MESLGAEQIRVQRDPERDRCTKGKRWKTSALHNVAEVRRAIVDTPVAWSAAFLRRFGFAHARVGRGASPATIRCREYNKSGLARLNKAAKSAGDGGSKPRVAAIEST